MRSVRCDVCGTKALMAASQCPKCGHLFEVRDGFGTEVPLAFCSSCDSYYPATVGSCKWCGTMPQPAPRGPLPWNKLGIGALVAMLWGVWLIRDPHPKPTPHTKSAAGTRVESVATVDTSVPVVTAPGPTHPVAERAASTAEVAPPTEAARDTVAATNAVVAATTPEPEPAPSAPPISSPPNAGPAPAPVAVHAAPRWVTLRSRNWVIVRNDARANAHIVASIGPDSRVQLGETAGPWRRIRSRDIAGWVDVRRSTFAPVRPAGRPRGFAEK